MASSFAAESKAGSLEEAKEFKLLQGAEIFHVSFRTPLLEHSIFTGEDRRQQHKHQHQIQGDTFSPKCRQAIHPEIR